MDKKVLLPEGRGSSSSIDNVSPGTSLEIPQPYDDIANSIHTIESNCRFLKQASKAIGTIKDNIKLRNNAQTVLFATTTIINKIKPEIHKLVYEARKKDVSFKLLVDRIKSRFEDSVEAYNSLQMELLMKLKRNLPSEPFPITQSDNKRNDYGCEDPEELLAKQQTFQRSLEDKQLDIIEREDAIRKIETEMLDINDIMYDLGTIIQTEGKKLDLIDNVIEDTQEAVESSRQEIEKATEYLNRKRKRVLYLVILLLLALVVAAVIIFLVLRNR